MATANAARRASAAASQKPAADTTAATSFPDVSADDVALGIASTRPTEAAPSPLAGVSTEADKPVLTAPPAPDRSQAFSTDELGPGDTPPVTNDVATVKRRDIWWVIDSTATEGPREHEPLVGVKYRLTAANWTPMPSAHAMVFLRDKAFVVKDDQHNDVASMPGSADIRVHRTLELQPGEVVAHIDELQTDALRARAVQYPGGGKIGPNVERKQILQFLGAAMLAMRNAQLRGPGETSSGGNAIADRLLEDADSDFTDRVLGLKG